MRGDKTTHGFEAAFIHTPEHLAIATAALQERGEVFKISKRKVLGFAGTRGWRIGGTAAEWGRISDIVHYALLGSFKAEDRVRTLIDTHRYGKPPTRPAGSLGTVTRVYAGDLHVAFDDDPREWNVGPTWFEVVTTV